MAEIAVNLVIDKLIPLLRDEVNLLTNVRGQIMSVKDQLLLMRAYLREADAKAELTNADDVVKEWVRQMRQVSCRIEDVIDEYLFKVKQRRPNRGGAVAVVCKICDLLRTVKPRHEISSQIGDITQSIERLNKAKETFGFNPSAPETRSHGGADKSSTLHYLRRDALFIEDDQLVGVDNTRQLLIGWLLGEGNRTVISVVGEGGLGKTTIVRNIYNKQKKSFDCYAWVTVSRSLREKHLLKTLLQSFYEEAGNKNAAKEISEMDSNTLTLIGKLREYLQGRSYMIVFDDVWEIDLWGDVESALPKDNGRIIITTRNKEVAEFCSNPEKDHIHELETLYPEDALKLFRLKAFQSDSCPEELKGLSQEFVKKCDGVPLAIVAIAGLLSTKKKNVLEWQRVYDSLRLKFSSDPHLRSFYQVLSESYHDLGYHLKLCLLYFGLFPEDYSISCVRLINLWIAEGFVEDKENEGQTLEEVAEEYLAELINRSLVKVAEEYTYGRVRSCRVHDLMHDFILKKCKELDFCQVKKSQGFRFHEWTRRLSIDTDIGDATMKSGAANYGLVRSCLVFNIEDMPTHVVELLFSSFKLLVRLDCEDAPLNYLPETVGNLFHLKYLNLRNTNIKILPRFIGKLQNLETLDLKNTQVRELPIEINRLIKLRHLLAYSSNVETDISLASLQGVLIKEGIGRLRGLQKLSRVDMTNGDSLIKEMKSLKQLRRIDIFMLRRHNGKALCSTIEGMTHLQSLFIAAAEEHEILDLNSLVNPPHHLQRLYLHGHLETMPHWIPKLHVLVRLVLQWSGLMEDPLPFLKDLPELLELGFYNAFEGVELYFGDGWFKKLKVLRLEKMQAMETLKIDRGALPLLEKLAIGLCPQMVEVPSDIQNLETLQFLLFYEMPMNSLEGKGYGILKNIPFVIYTKENKFYTLHDDARIEAVDS